MCLTFLKLRPSLQDLKWASTASVDLPVLNGGVASAQAKRIVKGPDQPLPRGDRSTLCFRTALTQDCTDKYRDVS